ncbi:hypothetical protein [Thermoflavimicrobium dichotomicum]|uniref:Uncharacterized protein n=1 Tax=Thermoflavimicrobium dichotomicum TaxID=46223 RepID=A0A1I3PS33_9BACL|nr:hypothetical protein [Thermoflavimicrobium dichotomicum]SFJ24147.1 hypothetical protein SAMN05421852_10689 [Thermoflavimicrobium dichotomicum]
MKIGKTAQDNFESGRLGVKRMELKEWIRWAIVGFDVLFIVFLFVMGTYRRITVSEEEQVVRKKLKQWLQALKKESGLERS